MTLFNKTKGLCRYSQSAAMWIILCFLLHLMWADRAWAQARTEPQLSHQLMQVQDRLRELGKRVAGLERFQRSIICGRLDSDLLKDEVLIYPLTCQLDRERPAPQIKPWLKVALIRPGVFKFEFEPPKSQKPLVLATALKSWGGFPIEMSSLRIADVTLTGFTIETFEAAGPVNPSNVSFFFVVIAEPSRLE